MPDLEVFVDDSGDCESCLSFTALCMRSGTSSEALRKISEEIEPLLEIFGLGPNFELHGTDLVREGALKPYQREFLYRHCLETIAGFPTMVVATVHWNWFPAPHRQKGEPPAWRHRLLWTRLLELLDEIALTEYDQPHDISSIIVDRSTNENRLLEQHDDHIRGHTGTRILHNPQFKDSESNRLLQATDLCAFAADLHARPHAVAETRRAKPEAGSEFALGWDWYRRHLDQRFANCIPGGGIRKLSGADAK